MNITNVVNQKPKSVGFGYILIAWKKGILDVVVCVAVQIVVAVIA